MIRNLYSLMLRLAAHRRALPALAVVSFLESSIFPVPPDAMLIPMVLARPDRAFLIASVCLAASVMGGLLGYVIGATAFDALGGPILQFLGQSSSTEGFVSAYNTHGAWAVLFAGLTPFPYKIITILSGATGLSLPIFIVSSIIARGLRFFLVAALLWKYGDAVREFIEKRLGTVIMLVFAAAVTLYLLEKTW